MRYLTLIALFFITIYANDVEEGKELYLEAKCQKCHLQDDKFDPNSLKKDGLSSKVKDKKGIKKWIVDCNSYFGVGWFPEEEEKVAKYLYESFYKKKLSK